MVKRGLQPLSQASNNSSSSSSTSSGDGIYCSAPSYPLDQAGVLVRNRTGYMVSLGTCSKLIAVGFIAGVIVGFTLKRRVRRWASRILRRIKDD